MFDDQLLMLARLTLDEAQQKRLKIVTAESCTGGLIAGLLTEIPGSSATVERGFIVYSNRAKEEMLNVPGDLIADAGAVSEPVARAMAEGALDRALASLAVAVTGIAGPGGSEHKPEGRVCFALAATGRRTRTETVEFGAIGRAGVRRATVDHALDLLLAATLG